MSKNPRRLETRAESEPAVQPEPTALVMPAILPAAFDRLRKVLKLSNEVSANAVIDEAAERLAKL